jgi:uncharacterized membrane protein YkvA (DUF1232 family)
LLDKIRAWAKRVRQDALTLWFAAQHPDTPWFAKFFLAFIVAYAFSPIDLIPDFIPILGYLDEVVLLPLAIGAAIRMLPPGVLDACRAQARESSAKQSWPPLGWFGAGLIVAAWVGSGYAIWHFAMSR